MKIPGSILCKYVELMKKKDKFIEEANFADAALCRDEMNTIQNKAFNEALEDIRQQFNDAERGFK